MRITPTMRDALRSRYKAEAKRLRPKTPDDCERVALSVVAELDPTDTMGLSGPADADRLRTVLRRIQDPKTPWND